MAPRTSPDRIRIPPPTLVPLPVDKCSGETKRQAITAINLRVDTEFMARGR